MKNKKLKQKNYVQRKQQKMQKKKLVKKNYINSSIIPNDYDPIRELFFKIDSYTYDYVDIYNHEDIDNYISTIKYNNYYMDDPYFVNIITVYQEYMNSIGLNNLLTFCNKNKDIIQYRISISEYQEQLYMDDQFYKMSSDMSNELEGGYIYIWNKKKESELGIIFYKDSEKIIISNSEQILNATDINFEKTILALL